MTIYEKLLAIQTELNAPKNLFNKFGGYSYRNCEGIFEAVKPLLKKYGCTMKVSDSIYMVDGRYYVMATATIIDIETGDRESVTADAREAETKKGMDESQITGTASSYARKYALNGLLLIDDAKDADTDEYHKQTHQDNIKSEAEMAKDSQKKIEDKYVTALMTQCAADKVDINKLNKKYGVKTLKELTFQQFSEITANWTKVIRKECGFDD